jgi:hypothetical protein
MSLTAWTKSWALLNVIKYLDTERFDPAKAEKKEAKHAWHCRSE